MDQRGFSLLEMIVTMAILGIAISVSGPPIVRLVEAAKFRDDITRVSNELYHLRTRAFLEARNITFDPAYARDANSELIRGMSTNGWQFDGQRVLVSKAGICRGGPVIIKSPSGRLATLTMTTRDCTWDD